MRSRSTVANEKDPTKALAESIAAGEPEANPPSPPAPSESTPVRAPRRRSEVMKPPATASPTTSAASTEAQPLPTTARREEPEAKPVVPSRAETDRAIVIEHLETDNLEMGGGYARIVTHLFSSVDDPMAAYQKIRDALQLGTRASQASYGELVDALDQAEEMASQAMELYVNAQVVHDAFEIDSKIILGALRESANAMLEDEKAKKIRTKTITNDDVEAVMATFSAGDWHAVERKRGQAKGMVDMLGDLCNRARERAKHLRTMVGGARRDA